MKASQLVRGYLQQKRVPLPLAGTTARLFSNGADPVGATASAPCTVEVGLKPLEPGEMALIFERARAFAVARGIESPKEGEELYEYGKSIHRCLLGVVDPDSDPAHPAPFFDGGLEQILGMAELGTEGILALAETHAVYQADVMGQVQTLDETSVRSALEELAGPHGIPFYFSLAPGLRVNLQLSTAHLLLASLSGKSASGPSPESNTTSGKKPTGKPTRGTRTPTARNQQKRERKATKKPKGRGR